MSRIAGILFFCIFTVTCYAAELDKAREHINAMEYTQAITLIEQYLASHGNDIEARFLLARTYAWDNQYAKAEQVYNELLARESDNTKYMFGKAQALIWQNNISEAIPLLDKITKHVPEEPEPLQLLILTLQQSSKPEDKARASRLLKDAKARFPKINWELIGQ
jgi:cytochrome c-type biogenesis protein CcmH/NrfG